MAAPSGTFHLLVTWGLLTTSSLLLPGAGGLRNQGKGCEPVNYLQHRFQGDVAQTLYRLKQTLCINLLYVRY